MVGGGKKRFNKSKVGKSSALFVQGGILSDWSAVGSPPSRARNSNSGKGNSSKSASRSENSGNAKKGTSSSALRPESHKSRGGSVFGYVYPAVDRQEGSVVSGGKDGDNNLDEAHPIVLVDSINTQVIAYFDQTPLMEPQSEKYTYEYSAGLGLDDTSHRGLGFSDEAEAAPSVTISSMIMEVKDGSCLDAPSTEEKSEEEMETDVTYDQEFGVCDDLFETPSLEKNSGYLSIAGVKIYTQDISDGEGDENDEEDDVSDGESLESSGSEESSGSSDSDGSFDSDSSIADEVAEDYFEGIGGNEKVVNADQLVGKLRHVVDDDGISGGSFNETLRKLGGIELQDASREYGMRTPQSGRKFRAKDSKCGTSSSALDDLMLVKDYRTVFGKKKHASRFPQSWPSEAQKNKHLRKFPGEKKKHRKEKIALKRWERMIRRGVDLEQINLKLQQMVLDGVDTLSFQPMYSQDCSQCHMTFWEHRFFKLGWKIMKLATDVAHRAVSSLEGIGVFEVELFFTADGQILLNEVAPRPHNSGHHSIESCFTSQYEQHLRAVVGLPLGDPSMKTPAAMMYNILVCCTWLACCYCMLAC